MRSPMPTYLIATARPLLVLLAVAAVAGPALVQPALAQQVYKTIDANGKVVYSDRAPSNATQVKVPQTPAGQQNARPATPAAAATGDTTPPPGLPVSNQQAQQVQSDVASARAEQCKQAKEDYAKSVRAQRMYKVNDKGEREFISPAEADAARLQMKAEMDGVCGS